MLEEFVERMQLEFSDPQKTELDTKKCFANYNRVQVRIRVRVR